MGTRWKKAISTLSLKKQITKGKNDFTPFTQKILRSCFWKHSFIDISFPSPPTRHHSRTSPFSLIPLDPNFTSLSIATAEASLRGKIPNNHNIIYYFKRVILMLLQNLASMTLSRVLFSLQKPHISTILDFQCSWNLGTLSWHYVLFNFIFLAFP